MYVRAAIIVTLLACVPGIASASLQCSETDRRGDHSVAQIKTDKAGTIESFHWEMSTPQGDRCEFDSSDFVLVPRRSSVEYRSAKGCRLFIWKQGTGITLAHNECEAQCTSPDAHDYLWPIVFDRNGKGCGRNK